MILRLLWLWMLRKLPNQTHSRLAKTLLSIDASVYSIDDTFVAYRWVLDHINTGSDRDELVAEAYPPIITLEAVILVVHHHGVQPRLVQRP